MKHVLAVMALTAGILAAAAAPAAAGGRGGDCPYPPGAARTSTAGYGVYCAD